MGISNVITIGNVKIGGTYPIIIQTMTTCKTSNIEKTINQINYFVKQGIKIVRVAVLDDKDANALKKICQLSPVPIIADIHYVAKYAIKAIKNGVAKIRINPNNIGNKKDIVKIIQYAKKHHVVIRIGINTGNFKFQKNIPIVKQLVDFTDKWIKFFEKNNFKNLVISIKDSNPIITYNANVLLAKKYAYPIHLGVTETGPCFQTIVNSCMALIPLLKQKIGSTIRISLNGNRKDEIKIAKLILNTLGIYKNFYHIIACPICGRNQYNTTKWVKELDTYLYDKHIPLTIAIMGCCVNCSGEDKKSDVSICVKTNKISSLFIKGKYIKDLKNSNVIRTLKEILKTKL